MNNIGDNQILIIDEASMVSNVYSEQEFFRFGSGYLLNDLMKFLSLSSHQKNNKVIFDLQFSLDHLGEKHDLSRKVRGLYEKSIETFKNLEKLRDKYRNFKLKINIVFIKENEDELDLIVSGITKILSRSACPVKPPAKDRYSSRERPGTYLWVDELRTSPMIETELGLFGICSSSPFSTLKFV